MGRTLAVGGPTTTTLKDTPARLARNTLDLAAGRGVFDLSRIKQGITDTFFYEVGSLRHM